MGLAAPKNRSKISNDPQNTTWANNTTRFGHRILASQGWQPGDKLGASDAAHAAHYTAASQSHIRVFLKDDNLGLGAKRGSERAENFGLAGLESILGRLNGKEAEVKKEEERREEIEKRAFVYRKYGMMNFVSGGFLVGDKIKSREDVKQEPVVKVEVKSELESDGAKEDSKKRKRKDREDPETVVEVSEEQPKLKRKKKSMHLREEAKKDTAEAASKSKKDKKNKKDKKSKKTATSDPEPMSSDPPTPASDPEPLTDKARRKAEKVARKEEKRLKKALKKAAKSSAKSKADAGDSSSDSEDESTPPISTPAISASTPTVSAAGLTYTPRGMHAVRQKWIKQKKMASMDPQAMREIFMIKTPV